MTGFLAILPLNFIGDDKNDKAVNYYNKMENCEVMLLEISTRCFCLEERA